MVISRRQLLIAATATGVLPSMTRAKTDMPFGLQLYSVGAALRKDFPGTLKQLRTMGYDEVEVADTLGKSGVDFRKGLGDAGLACRSMHVNVDQLDKDLDRTIAFGKDLGVTYVVCAFPRVANIKAPTRDEWLWHADFFNHAGAALKNAGLQLAYHNHNIEFNRYGKRSGYEELVMRTDPALLKLQLDCGWAAAAGLDPAAVLMRYPNRFRLLHVKDLRDAPPNTSLQIETTIIGEGMLDWPRIFAAAKDAGVVGYYVELEPPSTPDPLAAAKKSREFLAAL